MYDALNRHPDWYLYKINTGDDHVHLLLEFPPSNSVAAVIRELKSCTSNHLRKKFKYINEIYRHSGIWSVGYFVSTVGLNEDEIKRYIERQNNYDRGVDVTDEITSPNSHE